MSVCLELRVVCNGCALGFLSQARHAQPSPSLIRSPRAFEAISFFLLSAQAPSTLFPYLLAICNEHPVPLNYSIVFQKGIFTSKVKRLSKNKCTSMSPTSWRHLFPCTTSVSERVAQNLSQFLQRALIVADLHSKAATLRDGTENLLSSGIAFAKPGSLSD